MPSVFSRLKHGWNAFMGRDPTSLPMNAGVGTYYRPDRHRPPAFNERSIVSTIENRIALDVASIDFKHVQLDQNGIFREEITTSGLSNVLKLDANADQTGRAFMQDVVQSMFDEGCVAIVPTDTTENPKVTGSYDIVKVRTAQVIQWFPQHVQVNVYNERTGLRENIMLPKSVVAIIENPLYSVMNEPNSTLQRLIRTLAKLDMVNEQMSSGKLDLIIQLPYVIKSEARKQQAEIRRKEVEMQLVGSKYGIAYTDGTEKITQLNRSVDNNLMAQVQYLTSMLYNQLGLSQSIFDGTADEKTLLNYYNRTITPICNAIVEEMSRKFLKKTARTQGQFIKFFRDPFKLVPVSELANIADKFTRNEIASSNEMRAEIGWKPSDDPRADELRNKNISQSNEMDPMYADMGEGYEDMEDPGYEQEFADLDELDAELDDLERSLNHSDDALQHYASPYYDPVKAHEYYMRTRELKNRKSTAGLNEEGRNAAQFVKKSLQDERKSKVEAHKKTTDSSVTSNTENAKKLIDTDREKVKKEIETHKEQTQSAIDDLIKQRKALEGLSRAKRDRASRQIKAEIEKLRAANANKRIELRSGQKSRADSWRKDKTTKNKDLRKEHKDYTQRLKDEYEEKYVSELSRIRAERGFQKVKK